MTFTPRYIVDKAPGVGGHPIPPDEPCLVVRGQDRLAVNVLVHYITEYVQLPEADPAVVADLGAHLQALAQWQKENVHKIKMADR